MQTTSERFDQLAQGHVRPLSYGVRASFDKAFNAGVTFFTLDSSVLDGPDILAPSDSNAVQEWDKYSYEDYSSRAISVEVTREEAEPYSVAQAYADVTLNNYDGYYTPNSGSPIDQYILPRRPFRILLGFGGEVIPQFVGLSEGMPDIDKSSRQASFHLIDFMSYLMDKDISESVMLENAKTHEVLDYLLQLMGLLEAQYSLDGSINKMDFFFVEKGTKFGTVIQQLIEAEIGRFYLDEQGVIRFRNRYNYDLAPVYTFDKSNTIDYKVSTQTPIINSVKIISDVREVQSVQSIWTSSTVLLIKAGGTLEVWADLSDPTTSIVNPIYSAEETNTSYFTSSIDSEGTVPYSDVSLTSATLFSKAVKMLFSNTGASDAYMTAVDLYGTPAKVVDTIKVEEIDQPSIDKFEAQLYEINNPYIQDRSNAVSRALILLNDYKNYGSAVDIDVKGNPALQLGDAVTLDLDGYQGVYSITKTANILAEGKLTQRLRVLKKTAVTFFVLDESVLDGSDLLAP